MEPSTQTKLWDYIAEIVRTIKTSNQYEQAVHLVVDRIVRLYQAQTCAVILIDPSTEYLHVENSIGVSHTFCKSFRKKFAVGAIGEVLWTGRPFLIAERTREPMLAEEVQLEHAFDSCVCVQIGVDHRTLGYLHVDCTQPQALTREDVPRLQMFADLAGIAINKTRLHDEYLRLDTIDHDTELEKYTAFVRKFETALSGARAFNEPLAVLMMDVDNYKEILGTFGYERAVQFLKELGKLLRAELRSIDACGRYGFDEFIAMLVKTDLEQAVFFAQRFCRTVQDAVFVNNLVKTTVSIGVAAHPWNGQTTQDLLLTAKHALFEAQRAGRNNVFFYPAEWYASEHIVR
ncbi:MAG: hypothetical protein C4326_08380 [Ignavibacteria bacterium]